MKRKPLEHTGHRRRNSVKVAADFLILHTKGAEFPTSKDLQHMQVPGFKEVQTFIGTAILFDWLRDLFKISGAAAVVIQG